MEGQDATPQAERPGAKAPADPQIMARLLRIERRAARQGTRERKCAYGAVQLGKELRWVKEEQVYTKVDCASYDDWVKSRVRLEHSQAAVYCAVAPLPLRLLRGRALSLGRLQIIVKAPAWQWPVLCKHGGHFVSRMGASFMTAAGFPEWVAKDDDAYVAIAKLMAADRKALLALKKDLRKRLKATSAWDIVAHTRGIESTIIQIAVDSNVTELGGASNSRIGTLQRNSSEVPLHQCAPT